MIDVLVDALIDSLKVFGIALVMYVLISFIENKISHILSKRSKASPFIGSCFGLIPQCGIGVVAADLYSKEHISMGTLVAVFLSCSDEALPILISTGKSSDLINLLIILSIKFVFGFIVGYLVDLFFNSKRIVSIHMEHCEHHVEDDVHVGCCGHNIEDNHVEKPIHKHFIHPLVHSLKIFGFVLVINIIMGSIIYLIGGESVLSEFLNNTKWFGPIVSVLIGLIPNCVSSVVLSEVFLSGGISLGSIIAGLCVNAGLGLLVLFKSKKALSDKLRVLIILIVASLFIGYTVDLIMLLF